jgi:hypothetical protein
MPTSAVTVCLPNMKRHRWTKQSARHYRISSPARKR